MPRKIQTNYTKSPSRTLAAIGDSLTHNTTLGVRPDQFYPEQLAVRLRAEVVPIRSRNFGRSGNTTTQMLARLSRMTHFDIPDLAVVWGGVNDPGNSIPGATTQANIETMGRALLDAGVDFLVIGNTQYLNYTSGGDTLETPFATYATLRPFQQAAATTLAGEYPGRVAFADIYNYMRDKIVDGTEAAKSASWHVAPTDQHLNPLGERYVAEAVYTAIEAQDGWLDALRAG